MLRMNFEFTRDCVFDAIVRDDEDLIFDWKISSRFYIGMAFLQYANACKIFINIVSQKVKKSDTHTDVGGACWRQHMCEPSLR